MRMCFHLVNFLKRLLSVPGPSAHQNNLVSNSEEAADECDLPQLVVIQRQPGDGYGLRDLKRPGVRRRGESKKSTRRYSAARSPRLAPPAIHHSALLSGKRGQKQYWDYRGKVISAGVKRGNRLQVWSRYIRA